MQQKHREALNWKHQVCKKTYIYVYINKEWAVNYRYLFWENSNMSCHCGYMEKSDSSQTLLLLNHNWQLFLNKMACSASKKKKKSGQDLCFQGSRVSRHSCNSYWWNCLIIVPSLNWFIHFHFLFGSVALQRVAPSRWISQQQIFIIYFLPPNAYTWAPENVFIVRLCSTEKHQFWILYGWRVQGGMIFTPLLTTFHTFSLPPIHRLILTGSSRDWAGSWRRGEADEKRRCEPSSVSRVPAESLYISLSPQS